MASNSTITNSMDENVANLHSKLNAIFGSPPGAAGTSALCYSIEVAARDGFNPEQLDHLTPRPIFCSFPWISDENLQYEENFNRIPSLQLSKQLQKAGHIVVNHLSCYNLTEQQVDKFLATGVRNLFIIRGDTVTPGQRFPNAAHLVQYLRDRPQEDRERLTIGVGGYPYGHVQSKSDADELRYLQEKVDIGADFLLTQTLYDAESFFRYRERCRQVGITIPLIPGIYLPHSYQHLQTMLKITNITLPPTLHASFETHAQTSPEQFEAFVVEHFTTVVQKLLKPSDPSATDPVRMVHFFTFNKFSLLEKVLMKLKNVV